MTIPGAIRVSVLTTLVVVLAAITVISNSGAAAQDGSVAGSCPVSENDVGTYHDQLSFPLGIPDNDSDGVSDCIAIADGLTIADLNVAVTINHTWVGDLVVKLRHEQSGTEVLLINRAGVGPGNAIGCPNDDIRATLDDDTASQADSACSVSSPAINGLFRPTEPLAAFNGESIGGVWTINVSDHNSIDLGNLESWSLITQLEAPLGDANCNGTVDAIDAALILQFAAGLFGQIPCEFEADVNGDLQINPLDAALILQYIAGLIPSL
jgi:subtilisin-like proprotein convertase family protein